MTEVDTSPYKMLSAAAANPLQHAQQTVNLLSSMTSTAKAMQELEAKKLAGELMQKHINPQTGQVDWNKAAMAIASNPKTAILFPEMLEMGERIGGLSRDNVTKDLGILSQRSDRISSSIFSIIDTKGQNVKHTDIIPEVTRLLADGVIDAKMAASTLGAMAGTPAGPELYQKLLQLHKAYQPVAQATTQAQASIGLVNRGGQQDKVRTLPGGVTQTIGTYTGTPTGAEKDALVTTTSPAGQPQATPRAAIAPMFEGGANTKVVPGTGMAPPGASMPILPPVPGPQAAPKEAQPGPLPGPVKSLGEVSPPTPPPVAQSMTVPTGPTALQAGGLQATATYQKELNERVPKATDALKSLGVAREIIKTTPTGGLTEIKSQLASIAQGLGIPQKTVDGIVSQNGGNLEDAQVLQKIVFDLLKNMRAEAVGSQPSNVEWELLARSTFSPNSDPRATAKLLDLATKAMSATVDEQKMFNAYIKRVPSGEGFREYWNSYLLKNVYKMQRGPDGSYVPIGESK
jgi:hypothetical protein